MASGMGAVELKIPCKDIPILWRISRICVNGVGGVELVRKNRAEGVSQMQLSPKTHFSLNHGQQFSISSRPSMRNFTFSRA